MLRKGALIYQQEFGLLHYITEEKLWEPITLNRLLTLLGNCVMCQRKNIAENYVSHLISLSLIQTQTYTYPHILSSSQQKGDILKLTNLNHPQRWPKVAFLCITNGHLSRDSYFSTMMRGNKSNSNHWHFLDEGNVLCRSWCPPCPAPLSLWLRQMKYVIYSWFCILF